MVLESAKVPSGADHVGSVCLAALYLRGAPRRAAVRRRGWTEVESCLRRDTPTLAGAATALHRAGLWDAAIALEEKGLLAWAEGLWDRGECLTPFDDAYPARWRRLGETAPPAMWRTGPDDRRHPSRFLGIVGSREVAEEILAFAGDAGKEAARQAFTVVSGGAAGCDLAGERGAVEAGGRALVLLPRGLQAADANAPSTRLSCGAPGEPFGRGLAMERNALIYAAAEGTVVVHARFRQGGTWTGAVDALRRRLGRLLVREDPSDAACRALVGLGAIPVGGVRDLAAGLLKEEPQACLFSRRHP